MTDQIIDILIDAGIDTLKVFPFLFITYLVMELIEHKTGEYTQAIVKNSRRLGPLVGSVIGAVPQCGFSAAASSLYSGRIITVGTLIAVYLSTSDEMLPIFISERVPAGVILKILLIKVIIGMLAGFLLDRVVYVINKNKDHDTEPRIGHLCEHDHCHCEEDGVFKSALTHSLKITLIILIVNIALGFVITFVGEDNLANFLINKPVLGELLAGLIGLVPNCAASVIITKLYLDGVLGFGAMMAGLLVGAGIGLVVLFRTNDDLKKNLQIVGILYFFGVFFGILIEILGIAV